jgi:cobalamin biosynthesis protein CobT
MNFHAAPGASRDQLEAVAKRALNAVHAAHAAGEVANVALLFKEDGTNANNDDDDNVNDFDVNDANDDNNDDDNDNDDSSGSNDPAGSGGDDNKNNSNNNNTDAMDTAQDESVPCTSSFRAEPRWFEEICDNAVTATEGRSVADTVGLYRRLYAELYAAREELDRKLVARRLKRIVKSAFPREERD